MGGMAAAKTIFVTALKVPAPRARACRWVGPNGLSGKDRCLTAVHATPQAGGGLFCPRLTPYRLFCYVTQQFFWALWYLTA